jgi:hypothetical protein
VTFNEVLSQTIAMLQQHGRVSYRALKRQFALDDAFLEDLKYELIAVQQRALDQDGAVLVWTGNTLGNDLSLAPLMRLLITRTQGNPFFLEESVRTLVEPGVLVGTPRAYRLAQPVDSLQVPATVQAVLAARMDRLLPEEKHLLQTAAVIGTEVSLPLLQAIAEFLYEPG